MPSNADTINSIISNLLQQLNTESANPKPSYTIDGQQVDWNGWRAAIQAQIDFLRGQLVIEAPFEEYQRGM